MTTNAAVRGGDTRLTRVVDTYLSAWSEPDPVRRLEMIAGCWVDDGALVDPPLDGRGHAGISTLMATMQQHYPGHAFVRTTEVDLHHDTFRVGWELRGPGGEVALAGVDYGLVASDGRLCRISGFFSDLPAREQREATR
ncbi:hypothetical protein ACFFMR_32570 [Micromonospora andamanensis]|uniref:Nuclear transport factor 2 family protein n=1 Tax=Micromonospora andamanensis TaxID=1287068 RepID=A0ABQ4I213_9ACTN|nr:hypothetical protein [Micromonospora andamanensis]GIJ11943.1 hypothetical protein Van01_51570 [Micromonospora andamanensis]GIJ42160.1 hypothetical protein Vwe01_54850 [Micromonospora andamanensis]